MSKYKGIKTQTLKNGTNAIQVRFKHHGKSYGVKNFTKHFGVRTEKQAFEKLQEVKISLSKGINPFSQKSLILNDLWDTKLTKANWANNTKNHYINYYDIVIRKTIGKKSINKITYNDIMSLKHTLSTKSISYKNRLKVILNPIFTEALHNNNIINNPVQMIKNKVAKSATPIHTRVLEDELTIARNIYNALDEKKINWVKNQGEETNIFFMLLLLSAHRFGELLQLTKENIYDNKIVSPEEITKTKVSYEFPLPNECKDYINRIEKGRLFPNLTRGIVDTRFKILISEASLTLMNNKKITPHDTRRLFIGILVRNNVNEALADYCLEHKARGVISHYLHYTYEQKVDTYHKYWDLIKN